jgi:predicted nucleic acid-binding protein
VFTLGELFAGAESSRNIRTVSFLKRSGTPVPLMDILIGTSAKEQGLAVLTRDVSHFRRIPMLSVMEY